MSEQNDRQLTVDEVNELVGDDIAYWLSNPFMSPEMLAEKVCWWIGRALSNPPAEDSR